MFCTGQLLEVPNALWTPNQNFGKAMAPVAPAVAPPMSWMMMMMMIVNRQIRYEDSKYGVTGDPLFTGREGVTWLTFRILGPLCTSGTVGARNKLAHLYHPIVWYKCKSLRMWFVIRYHHKIYIFAVLERWLLHDCETECSFVYLIFAA